MTAPPFSGECSPMINRSEEHTSELQSLAYLVCRLLLEKKNVMDDSKNLSVVGPLANNSITKSVLFWISLSVLIGLGCLLALFFKEGSCIELTVIGLSTIHIFFALVFFFNDTATTEIYTLSLHDALPISGIHHVTAISSDPQQTLDFYAGTLGMRLVKRTVNFDDPTTYHFYFGDAVGHPGSILTFLDRKSTRLNSSH